MPIVKWPIIGRYNRLIPIIGW